MHRGSVALAITILVVALVSAGPATPSRAADTSAAPLSAPSASYFFHGTPLDQVNKANVLTDPTFRGTATFDTKPPTGLAPITQTEGQTFEFNTQSVGSPASAYWRGPFTGTVAGQLLELKWFWSTPNPETVLLNGTIDVTVFADPDYVANRVQPQHIIGHQRAELAGILPAPRQMTTLVPITGNVTSELLIQVFAVFVDTGNSLVTYYDSTTTPSSFRFIDTPVVVTPAVTFDTTTAVAFAPSTVVSAHFLGAEPQMTMERRIAASQPGRIDPNRIFVDWPLSSRSNIGQLSRSTDGGDSFRLLLDLTCAVRSRPNCFTGGGGDTEDTVNLANGNLFFSDQELLANIAEASSTDHGDSFPATRQFALTNVALVTDRHWLAATDGVDVTVAGQKIDAFLAYHGGPVTTVGQYVQGITSDGVVLPQPAVGQIRGVSQSGPIRFDASSGPGRGWIYQAFYNSSGIKVATAFGNTYIDPSSWVTNNVASGTPLLFPWLQLDNAGNAYVSWSGSTNGVIYLSISPINDPRNDPTQGGRPGTYWTPQVRVTPPQIKSSIFAAVVGGDAGRIVVAYTGSEDCAVPAGSSFIPDNCALATTWNTYASIIPNALNMASGTAATIFTGKVSHRVMHRGTICTGGTVACLTADRSLLDMEDVGFDESGRVGLIFMDNNNRLAAPNLTDASKNAPFTLFAKQVAGPSLIAATPTVSVPVAEGSVVDPPGDATWPNTAGGAYLKAADLLGAQAFIDAQGQLVARIPVGDSTPAGIQSDIALYNSRSPSDLNATRFQYVFRFATADDVWHLSFEQNADGTGRFFGGRLDANDGLMNIGSTAIIGAAYHTDSIAVNGSTRGNVITLRAKASDFGLSLGSRIVSATAFSLAAQPESTELTIANVARTIDATPPFDATLALGAEPALQIDCTDPAVVTSGGWHTLSDPRAGNGTLCRSVNGQKHGAFMQLGFTGQAIDVIGAKGPRGGTALVSIDGIPQTKIDEFRPPTDPLHPDNTGRKDLDFGVTYHFATSNGSHVLRIDVLNDSGDPTRNMFYVDGLAVTAGDTTPPPPGATTDIGTTATGTALPLVSSVLSLVTDAAASAITVVIESVPGATVTISDPAGNTLATATVGGDGVVEVAVPVTAIGTYSVSVMDSAEAAFVAWEIVTERR